MGLGVLQPRGILRVELFVPAAMLQNGLVLRDEQRAANVRFMIPYRNIPFKLINQIFKLMFIPNLNMYLYNYHNGFSPQEKFGKRCYKAWSRIETVDDLLDERL